MLVATMSNSASSSIPPPHGQVLSLVAALSSPENHDLHVQAIQACDQAMSASTESYANLCFQLCVVMIGSDNPVQMLQQMSPTDHAAWSSEPFSQRLAQHPSQWVVFGQVAGLVLKNALLRPPILPSSNHSVLHLQTHHAKHMQQALLQALTCQEAPLRAVASSIIASCAVSCDSVQPALHVSAWPTLMPTLIQFLKDGTLVDHHQPASSNNSHVAAASDGALTTIRKIMEDGPTEIPAADLDQLVPLLVRILSSSSNSISTAISSSSSSSLSDTYKIGALQSLQACLTENMMPSALVADWEQYLAGLSHLSTDPNPVVRQWVCRTMVTLLELRTEYLQPHLAAVAEFMLTSTSSATATNTTTLTTNRSQSELVALEACEFWLTFCNLDEDMMQPDMIEVVGALLPRLVPVLLNSMVYGPEQRAELLAQNELDMQQSRELLHQQQQHPSLCGTNMRPLFHKSKAQPKLPQQSQGISPLVDNHQLQLDGSSPEYDGYLEDDEGDDDDDDGDKLDDEEDGNVWTLRKCAAASLDSLANLFGAGPLLPSLLPALKDGLTSSDPWIQEASILALGAIAEGCHKQMEPHMEQLHAYLINHLAAPEGPNTLPQVKSIAAWTIGRYSGWVVEQVQTGQQGHLLAHVTEVFLARLHDRSTKVQVATCSAFGVVIEAAGDLMAPYLQPIYEQLVWALSNYQGRSLLVLFDVLAIIADFCGPAIAEGNLPSIYVPPLLSMWERVARHDPANRMLLPLMESLASIALTSGMSYHPYALQTFEHAMCIIEMVTLQLTASDEQGGNEEGFDPIICAADLLDGLTEGMGSHFQALVNSSQKYGMHFLSVLHSLCGHEIPGVRMSALALVGDLARSAPALLEPALPQLLKEAVASMDPIQPSVCTNAVWAIGEICVRCQGNPRLVQPFAQSMIQNLLCILSGNGLDGDHGIAIPGLAENAAACLGRLGKVDANLVAPDLSRLLLGWCDGLAKIADPTERRDAFEGFVKTVYANPAAIQQATTNVTDAVMSIIFCIVTWHMPMDFPEQSTSVLHGDYCFLPFPPHEAELGKALLQLMRDLKLAVGEETWYTVQKSLPVNVRRLLREAYHL